MHAIAAPPEITSADRLGVTVFLAVAAHLILILGVTFVQEDRSRPLVSTLDVVLVQQRTEREPDKADYLAQATQEGGGESDERARPSTPTPAPFTAPEPEITASSLPTPPIEADTVDTPAVARAAPAAEPAEADSTPQAVIAKRVVESESRLETEAVRRPRPRAKPLRRKPTNPTRQRFAQSEPERASPTGTATETAALPQTPPTPTRRVDATALVNRTLAMASISAEIDRKLKAYAERPRRKWISARTREHKYAAYMEAWRRKVERIGNLNYPDEARRRKLSGKLLLDVALNPNGSIKEITLRRSSGERVLDDAAMRIVKLAAPFGKFPKSIAEEVDILHIERTWLFLASNRFSSH